MGAINTILNLVRCIFPSSDLCIPICYKIVNKAILVLPAPVGAQTSIFSADLKAQGKHLV